MTKQILIPWAIVVILTGYIVSLGLRGLTTQMASANPSSVGRYQFVVDPHATAYLCDTQTGRLWVLSPTGNSTGNSPASQWDEAAAAPDAPGVPRR
ncbi:MAG: hypothetical protein LC772_05460 [Chloroflexi bacterium]|nr:hypothetical protein [Chloroflexota bacterium]